MPRTPKNPLPLPSSPRPNGRGRPPSIDSERLLTVAREVFLERGIRATTLEVAERAGVSEGVLFHRFKSKEGLFGAAMEFDQEAAPTRLLTAGDRVLLYGPANRKSGQYALLASADHGASFRPL